MKKQDRKKCRITPCRLNDITQAIVVSLQLQPRASQVCALSLCTLLSMANPSQAATFTVMNNDDTGAGSLRAAISLANVNVDADVIVFDASVSGSIASTSGVLVVTNPLTITGPGDSVLAIVGNGTTSVFANQSDLVISGLTIRGGQRNSGGGFFNAGNLTITNSRITDNDASSGGGIYNDPGNATTTIEINNSTIDDNEASNGGGIYSNNTGAGTANININNSTISGNTAQSQGGGIFSAAKNNNNAQAIVTINNSTISGNTANNNALRDGGGIYNYASNGGTANVIVNSSTVSGNMANSASGIGNYSFYGTINVRIRNSTITGNTATSTSGNNGALYAGQYVNNSNTFVTISNSIIADQLNGDDCSGFMMSNGYNIDSDGSCNFNQPSDLPNINMSFLDLLANNGGPTFTHALLAGSPAIDAIPVGVNDCGTDPVIDQRGESRLQDGDNDATAKCDIGAYEKIGLSLSGAGKMGDFAWEDLNGNGIQDSGEPGLDYVMMNLRACNSPTIIDTTMSDLSGMYLFDEVPVGNFQIEYILPPGHHFSPAGVGHWSKDSNVDTDTGLGPCIAMPVGKTRLALDVGVVPDNPAGTGVIGDYIWDDVNGNGIQNSSELGLGGVMIDLLDCNAGDAVVTSTISAPDGSYAFNTVAVGDFRVRFNPVAGHSYSPTGQGAWFNNSDAGFGGKSGCRSMVAGQVRNGIDGGYVPDAGGGGTGKIGDFVWDDMNKNGIQENSEPGLANVMVELYSCNGPNVFVETKMTGVNGDVLFTDLDVGKYRMKFTALPGYQFSSAGQGGDYQKDSNVNVNSGFGPCLPFSAGQVRLGLDAGMHQ